MDWPLLLLFILGGLILLLCMGVPVAFAFTLVNVLGAFLFWGGEIGLSQLILSIYDSVTKFTLLPIVMFIMMGEVMFHSGIGIRMIDALDKWIGRLPGRLGLMAVVAGALFSTMSGSSIGTTGMLGTVLVIEPGKDPAAELEKVKEYFGGEAANKVIIAAKDLSAMALGLSLAEKGGTILFFATPHPDESIQIHPSEIFFNELIIKSSYSADHNDTRMALELLSRGDVDGSKIITNIYPLERLSDAILQTASREESLKCVISFE